VAISITTKFQRLKALTGLLNTLKRLQYSAIHMVEAFNMVAAPVNYRQLVTDGPLDHTIADRATHTALAAV
jgi:hypothetical protein